MCDEYKDLVAEHFSVGGMSITGSRIINKYYNCNHIGSTGMIFGGKPTTPAEFPHMAGKLNERKKF